MRCFVWCQCAHTLAKRESSGHDEAGSQHAQEQSGGHGKLLLFFLEKGTENKHSKIQWVTQVNLHVCMRIGMYLSLCAYAV